MPSNSKLTKEGARAAARRRLAQAEQERERQLRQELENTLARERAQRDQNKPDIAAFLSAESEIQAMAAKFAEVNERCSTEMGLRVDAIAAREGSVSAAAALLGISASKAQALRRAVHHAGESPRGGNDNDGQAPVAELVPTPADTGASMPVDDDSIRSDVSVSA